MDLEPILARIRAEVERRGWSIAQLASEAGKPPAYSNPASAASSIGRLLKGEIDRPSLLAVGQICAVLGIPFGVADVENSTQVAGESSAPHILPSGGREGTFMRFDGELGAWVPSSVNDYLMAAPGSTFHTRDWQGRTYLLTVLGDGAVRFEEEAFAPPAPPRESSRGAQ